MDGLTIGELARRGGVNLETIRFYERTGILPKPPRTDSGYRMFPADAVRRIRFVKHAQNLGFSLKEIQELMALRLEPDTTCQDVRRRAEAKVKDVDEKIRSLRAIRKSLAEFISSCPGRGEVSKCPLLESLDSPEVRT